MTRTTDNEATETVSEVTLTASTVNSIQINGASTSTKVSIGEGNCTCWYNKCTQHLKAQIFFAVTMYIIGVNLSEPLMVIESHWACTHVCFLATVFRKYYQFSIYAEQTGYIMQAKTFT